jgi:hypothetical protein
MSRYYIKDVSYVCDPQNLAIKMIYESDIASVNINFFYMDKKCFDLTYKMPMTDDSNDYDMMLAYVLDSLFNQLTKQEFHELILDGELLGLIFHMRLNLVKNKGGKAIWLRH